MGGRKRSTDWHHRVPDFKLVYCGPKRTNKEEINDFGPKERLVDYSIAFEGEDATVKKLKSKAK